MLFLNFLLLALETVPKVVKSRFIVVVPLLKFLNGASKMVHQGVDRAMIFHHLFMMDSALVRVFGLHEDGELPEERPGGDCRLIVFCL